MFCLLWELRAWDHHEIKLIGFSSGKPWIATIFSYFYWLFILWFKFPFCPFGCEVAPSYFIVSALFLLLFWWPFVWRLINSGPLYFCMLVLLSWAGTNISLFFGMRVWVFAPLCWSFLYTVSELNYFWIFGVFVPKGQMGFDFKVFDFLGFLPWFACHPVFSSFLGMMLFMDLDYP